MSEAEAARLEGNALYKEGKAKEALTAYSKALRALADPKADSALAIHKNMAACYIKLENWEKAREACDKALELAPHDVKALFRRGQAYEMLGDKNKAFTDMATASKLDPKNKAAVKEAQRLMASVASGIDKSRSTEGVSSDMVTLALEGETLEKRKQAVKNCVVLTREIPSARKLLQQGVPLRFLPLLQDADEDIRVHAIHVYGGLAEQGASAALSVLAALEQAKALDIFLSKKDALREMRATVRTYMLLLEALSEGVPAEGSPEAGALDKVLEQLIAVVRKRNIDPDTRDLAINAMTKNMKRADVGQRFILLKGVKALLITAALSKSPLYTTTQSPDEPSSVRDMRGHVSVAIRKVYEATKAKGVPNEDLVKDCFSQVRFTDDPVANIPPANTMIAVMLAVLDIGNQILEQESVFTGLMAMANSENLEAQCAAAEALSHAASDKKRCRGLMVEGFPILKKLYSKDLPDTIRVRALCGLCKMGSTNAGAVNQRTMSETSVINLAKKLRPFLVDDKSENDTRKWAAEGMAYLSLDADVKEYVINDDAILAAVHRVCMGSDPTLQYALANMLVNISNSFDKPEITPEQEELKKLGKFAGESIPEPHQLDAVEYIKKRVQRLVERNFVTALVELSKSESEGAREQVSRVLLAMCEDRENRGNVIAGGGAKALLALFRENNTEKGKLKAAHALAKIAITSDPSLAFPGQRTLELVKPLVRLSKERNGLMMFESAMAITNLGSISDEVRLKMLREKAIARLEDMMFDEDTLIRRAAVEALLNCLYTEEIFLMFASKDGSSYERLKLWILYSGVLYEEEGEFDLPLCKAASGGLALLSRHPDTCKRIKEERQGYSILKELLVCGDDDLKFRGLYIVCNMIDCDKELAKDFVEQEMLMILSALSVTPSPQVRGKATEALEALNKQGLISSLDDVKRSAAEAAHSLAAAEEKMKEEARARQGANDEEEEEADEDEDADGDEEVEHIDLDQRNADAAEEEEELVAVSAGDADEGPKIEVLDD